MFLRKLETQCQRRIVGEPKIKKQTKKNNVVYFSIRYTTFSVSSFLHINYRIILVS